MNKHYFSLLAITSMLAALAPTAAKAQRDSLTLSEVVVTGTRGTSDVRHLPQTISVINRHQLTANQRSNVLPTLLEQVPGLMVTSRGMMGYGVSTGGTGGMMLRGISSGAGQVMVLIDGHPQYNGIYGHSISDAYQTMMAERVEVLRGPASLLYGSNAMGGVINIVTRNLPQDGTRTNVHLGAGSWGTFEAEASNQTRIKDFSSTVSAQYSRTDNHRPGMGFEQFGGYAKLGYDFSPRWNAFATVDVTHFNASYPGTVDVPMREADQSITRGVVSAGIDNHYDKTSGRLSVYYNFGNHKINDGYNATGGKPQTRLFRSTDALSGITWYQSADLWTGGKVTLGFEYQNIYGHAYYTDRETGEVLETQNKQSGEVTNHEIAGYADIRQELLSWLTLDAGIRYDHHSITGSEWIPQAGLVIRPMRSAEIKATAGKGFRNPTMREMYLYPPSNTELRPERLWNYEVAWRHHLEASGIVYGINAFYLKADNVIQTINRKNINTGELENYGIEGELTWQISRHWSLNTNHSYLHMAHPVISAPEYKGYLGLAMHYGRWTANAGLMQVCGMRTNLGDDKQQIAAKKENFTLLNATVSYRPLSWMSLWAKGENLTATRYEYVEGMPMPRATFMAGIDVEF